MAGVTSGLWAAILAGLVLGTPQAALALSCEAPSFVRAFWRHKSSEATYLLALGGFSELRMVQHDTARDRVVWRARFDGHRAGAGTRAFDQPFTAEVTIIDPLLTDITGGLPPDAMGRALPGRHGLVFLEKTAAGYQVFDDICTEIVNTDPKDVRRALNCLRGRACPKPKE